MSGGSREPDHPPRADDDSGNTVVIETGWKKAGKLAVTGSTCIGGVKGSCLAVTSPAHASACFEQPIVRNTAGFHFDKWQLDWPRIARQDNVSHLSIP